MVALGKFTPAIVAVLATLVLGQSRNGQTPASSTQLLTQAIAALGGNESLSAVRDVTYVGGGYVCHEDLLTYTKSPFRTDK